MRWAPFLIFAYLLLLAQSTLGHMLMLDRLTLGPVGPDLMALLAVFVGLYVRGAMEGVTAGWVLGMMIDLTTAGGAGMGTRVGPMALFFALGVWMIFQVREAIYRERALPQMLVAAIFCLLTHSLWVLTQAVLAPGLWPNLGRLLVQVLLSAVYSGLLMPLVHFVCMSSRGWFLTASPGRSRRSRSR